MPLSPITKRSSSLTVMLFVKDLTKISVSHQRLAPRISDVSQKSQNFLLWLDKSALLLSFLHMPKIEISQEESTRNPDSNSLNVILTLHLRSVKKETPKDSIRKQERALSRTSLVYLTHMRLLNNQNSMLTLETLILKLARHLS